jgi:hypothetical protein
MGYDMYSNKDGSEEGYFRLNIFGMGWMRSCIIEGDPSLREEVLSKMCSNDGFIVGARLGKKIGTALRVYAKKHPIGQSFTPEPTQVNFEKEVMGMINSLVGSNAVTDVVTPGKVEQGELMTQDMMGTIIEFAEYNETKAPYRVC